MASLSEAVGEIINDDGKVVWFELEERADRADGTLAAIVQQVGADDEGARRLALDGILLAVPVSLAIRGEDHVADVRRELKLLGPATATLGGGAVDVGGLLTALDSLGGTFPYCDTGAEQVRVAAGLHRSAVDVLIPLTDAFAESLRVIHRLLVRTDELAAGGHLLARPASTEIRHLWSWSVEQVASQLSGATPTAFGA